jgi:hypothetical protein
MEPSFRTLLKAIQNTAYLSFCFFRKILDRAEGALDSAVPDRLGEPPIPEVFRATR